MITVSTLTSVSATDDVNIRYRLSGVVMSRSTGWRSNACRSRADVSPVRIATVGWWNGTPSRSAARPMPISGARRFFSMSKASARKRRDVQHTGAALRIGGLRRAQSIDRREEGCERLSATRRSAYECVGTTENRRPTVDLRRGRLWERCGEPGPNGGRERLEDRMKSHPNRLRRGCYRSGSRSGSSCKDPPIELNDP